MVWTRLSDDWTDRVDIAALDFPDRWHYLAMIQLCSRSGRFDGHLRRVDALRASDHPDPAAALPRIAALGLIVPQGEVVIVSQIDDHIPPPSVRAKSTPRTQRHKKHAAGDHSLCLPENCGDAADPTAGTPGTRSGTHSETGSARTGQDRPEQANDARAGAHARESARDATPTTEWETARIPGADSVSCTRCIVCDQALLHPDSQKSCVCGKRDAAHEEARAAV